MMACSGELAKLQSCGWACVGWLANVCGVGVAVKALWHFRHQRAADCSETPSHPLALWLPASQLRRGQRQRVTWAAAEEAVLDGFRQDPAVRYLLDRLLPEITSGELPPRAAAELLSAWHNEYV